MHIDGIKWVKDSPSNKYDLVICDSTDPTDTGKSIFSGEFYKNCSRILKKDGMFVCQGESLYYDYTKEITLQTYSYLKKYFTKSYLYQAYIPTYQSGHWMYAFATKSNVDPVRKGIKDWNKLNIKTKYYNTGVHLGAFALPNYIEDILKKTK
jgi:spermidine synthase